MKNPRLHWCECEHINHTSEHGPKPGHHPYGATRATQLIKLRDMGPWHLCQSCVTICHKDNIQQ